MKKSTSVLFMLLAALQVLIADGPGEPTGSDSLAGTSLADFDWDIEGIEAHTAFCALPAQEVYNHWDENDIHPYHFDPQLFDDTICLQLVSEASCGFVHPVSNQRVTSEFGPRRYRWHYGIDIDLNTGDAVFAAFDGVVRVATYSSTYGYVVVVRHYNGLETLYSHLSKLQVTSGQEIEAGHQIGLGGRTGRATGSHLHFEVRYKGWSIDPRLLIDFDSGTLKAISIEFIPDWLDYMTYRSTGGYYEIKRGDTLYDIAAQHGMSLGKLLALNNLSSRAVIHPGQKLRIRE
jgi:murein DD-endopeptidase MepM/ murein hydrolase activator NlpD